MGGYSANPMMNVMSPSFHPSSAHSGTRGMNQGGFGYGQAPHMAQGTGYGGHAAHAGWPHSGTNSSGNSSSSSSMSMGMSSNGQQAGSRDSSGYGGTAFHYGGGMGMGMGYHS